MKPRKIELLKRYLDHEIETAEDLDIVNGCGGSGGVDFDFFLDFVSSFKKFDLQFIGDLKNDFIRLCNEHDLDYFLQKGFYKSNFIFCWKITRLIKSWTSIFERYFIFKIMLFLLNHFGKKYYKDAKEHNKKMLNEFYLALGYEI